MTANGKIGVLIVDDSAIVRQVLRESLSAEPDLEVVGTAPDAFIARDKILALHPDVLTLDIEMPRMDGLTFLRRLMIHRPMPVIVVSSLVASTAAVEALGAGAVDVVAKPGGPYTVADLRQSLAEKIRAAAAARVKAPAPAAAARPASTVPPAIGAAYKRGALLAVGASTGGTDAIAKVLVEFPADCPPVLIAQHIPPVFSRAFAERLNSMCQMRVREAQNGDRLEPGLALVAPGDHHMLLKPAPEGRQVEIKKGPKVCYQRPSVDVLFHSVAQYAGADATAALLTGMGADGAQGMLAMHRAGAHTIAQDEATCIVFGMPREAIRLGGVDRVLALQQVAAAMLEKARRA